MLFSLKDYLFAASTIVAVGLTSLAATTVVATDSKTHIVEIVEFKYIPEKLTVEVGDKVVFKNLDLVPHTATAVDKSWDTGYLSKNDQVTITVTEKTAGEYFCAYHPTMKATLSINW